MGEGGNGREEILRNSREGENAPGGIRTHGLWFRRPTLYPQASWGHPVFLFAIFACFAVRFIADTPFEFHEPQMTRTVRTRKNKPQIVSRFSRISRLEMQWSLWFRILNRERREQRERYEQRLQRTLLFNPPVEIQTQTLEGSPVFFSQGLNTPFFSSQELLGTLPFLFAIFACFAVRIPANYSGLSL